MFTAGDNGWLTLGKMKPGKGTAEDNTVAEGSEHLGTAGDNAVSKGTMWTPRWQCSVGSIRVTQ